MQVLVVGGGGFIGAHVAAALCAAGYVVWLGGIRWMGWPAFISQVGIYG